MAQGDIPVEGSAVVGGAFPLKARAKQGENPNDSIMSINTSGKPLRIFENNGGGKIFNEPLVVSNWKLEIIEDTPANAASRPPTSV